ATRAGFIQAIAVRELGECVVDLGGGRRVPGMPIDHAVGLADVRGRGERVDRGEPLAIVHARTVADADAAATRIRSAFRVGEEPALPAPLLRWLPQARDPLAMTATVSA
ncbi:MAG: hypothetical protein JSS33_07430, partial [Proteobacteria bacterium]|nr:hypothetical protein [Pseudomonadota bacterium]